MRNIFLFIRQYFTFITFLILQLICIVALSKYSKTHEAFFSKEANEITGRINTQYNKLHRYLYLTQENDQLAKQIAILRDSLNSNFVKPDTSTTTATDTTIKDDKNRYRKYSYLPALVVGNTVSLQTNTIMLERGKLQGVHEDMGVVGPAGIVGKVVSVSDNYCEVMSLLNKKSKVSAMFKRGKEQYAESVSWDGKDADYLIMEKVSKAVDVKKGDTLVTSGLSTAFPSMLMVGTVAEIKTDATSSTYTLKIKSATNFRTLQHVNIIANSRYSEQYSLDTATQNKLKQIH